MTFLKKIALPIETVQANNRNILQKLEILAEIVCSRGSLPLQSRLSTSPFSQRTEEMTLLKQAEKETKKPLLDPFGWNKPSLETLLAILIYGLNLFYNSVNFSKIPLGQDSNLSKTSSDAYREESKNANLYVFIGNTLGILALGILYTLYKIEKINKDHTITMVPQNIKNLLYLPMFINTILEIVLRIKNQPINPAQEPLLNTITPCINSGALILKTVFYTLTRSKALELSAQNAVYGVASHRVLSKLKELLKKPNQRFVTEEVSAISNLIKNNTDKDSYIVLHMVANYLKNKTTINLIPTHTPNLAQLTGPVHEEPDVTISTNPFA